VGALDNPSHFQLALWDSADAVGSEVGVSCLDAAQAAQVLISLLLPLGDQVLVCVPLLYAVVIQLPADGLPLVEQVEDVAAPLVVQSEDRPQGLHLPLALVRLRFGFSHLLVQLVQGRFNQLPAVRRRLPASLYFRHLS